jgi:hypothetical protein
MMVVAAIFKSHGQDIDERMSHFAFGMVGAPSFFVRIPHDMSSIPVPSHLRRAQAGPKE